MRAGLSLLGEWVPKVASSILASFNMVKDQLYIIITNSISISLLGLRPYTVNSEVLVLIMCSDWEIHSRCPSSMSNWHLIFYFIYNFNVQFTFYNTCTLYAFIYNQGHISVKQFQRSLYASILFSFIENDKAYPLKDKECVILQ